MDLWLTLRRISVELPSHFCRTSVAILSNIRRNFVTKKTAKASMRTHLTEEAQKKLREEINRLEGKAAADAKEAAAQAEELDA